VGHGAHDGRRLGSGTARFPSRPNAQTLESRGEAHTARSADELGGWEAITMTALAFPIIAPVEVDHASSRATRRSLLMACDGYSARVRHHLLGPARAI